MNNIKSIDWNDMKSLKPPFDGKHYILYSNQNVDESGIGYFDDGIFFLTSWYVDCASNCIHYQSCNFVAYQEIPTLESLRLY